VRQARGFVRNEDIDCAEEEQLDGESSPLSDLVFNNDEVGERSAELFCLQNVLPLILRRCGADTCPIAKLYGMVRSWFEAGRVHRDICGLSEHAVAMKIIVDKLLESVLHRNDHRVVRGNDAACVRTSGPTTATVIVTISSGGTQFASPVAVSLGLPLIVIRKAKSSESELCFETSFAGSNVHLSVSASTSDSRNGEDSDCMRTSESPKLFLPIGAVPRGARVILIDDVLATGNTVTAVHELVALKAGASLVKALVVAEFTRHNARPKLEAKGMAVESILKYDSY
jgi:adenine/guanine phosphoribosyltransferase-like PRPP-binding protein